MNTVEGTHIILQPDIQHRARALSEVWIAYGLLECALWSTHAWQLVWGVAMLLWVALCTWRADRTADEVGIGRSGLRQSLWIVPLAIIVSVGMIFVAWFAGSLHGLQSARTPLWHALLYVVWALVQEFLTLSFIFVRFEDAFGATNATFFTAALFCLAHIPNPVLMAATFPMAVGFCWAFRRYRNIYSLAIAHALLGLTIAASLSSAVTHSMKVGIAYF
jgi:membrane protease YdiL (CAAX protease family)